MQYYGLGEDGMAEVEGVPAEVISEIETKVRAGLGTLGGDYETHTMRLESTELVATVIAREDERVCLFTPDFETAVVMIQMMFPDMDIEVAEVR